MPAFVPGLTLSRRFFEEAVRPIIDRTAPGLAYDAALIDGGSEVLGFDDEMSRDHHWGPRVSLFLRGEDLSRRGAEIDEALRTTLPLSFLGYSTSFEPGTPGDDSLLMPAAVKDGRVNHRVSLQTVGRFVRDYLGFDPAADLTHADWLASPQQPLRTLARGGLFYSGLGEIAALRERLAWCPKDVWLYLLACGWKRIGEERAFIGRAGDIGDDLGSRIIGARLTRDVMMLAFLMERTYAPYAKWFGRAFLDLASAAELTPPLRRVLVAGEHRACEAAFVEACEILAVRHNALGLTDPVPTRAQMYFSRPYRVIDSVAIVAALTAAIGDPALRALADAAPFGGIDQFSDSTDLKSGVHRGRIKGLYDLG